LFTCHPEHAAEIIKLTSAARAEMIER